MDKNKTSFNTTIQKAINLGYAEANPSSDINGDDEIAKVKFIMFKFNSFKSKHPCRRP